MHFTRLTDSFCGTEHRDDYVVRRLCELKKFSGLSICSNARFSFSLVSKTPSLGFGCFFCVGGSWNDLP
jgi:hypothetical protein